METRKIVIVNSKTQKQSVIQASSATTLGELKAEMRELNISHEGMTFFEGHARVELKDDASVLPSNIAYKGNVVNDLTFLLTAPEKKIRSGAMSRPEAYAGIKALGLKDKVQAKFGKNFTQCSTTDLEKMIVEASASKPAAATAKEEKAAKAPKAKKQAPVVDETKAEAPVAQAPVVGNSCKAEAALKALVEDLYGNDTIEEETYDNIMEILNGGAATASESDKLSKKELNDLFGGMLG